MFLDRLEGYARKLARLLLVRWNALSFSACFAAYVFVLWYSGCLKIIDPSPNPDRSELANVALALTGIAALVGASLATYQLQRSTKHARRAAQATFLLQLEGRFMSPKLREAQDALREIWTEANTYFDHLVTNYTERNLNDLDEILRNTIKQYREGHDRQNNKAELLSRHIAHELEHLRNTNQHLYHVLLRNCEIFETIGLLVKHGYLDVKDVNGRFKYAVDRAHVSFRRHVEENGIFGDARPFDNAIDLAENLKDRSTL